MELPSYFRQKIINNTGARGKKWLADLPELICHYEKKWNFKVTKSLTGDTYGYISEALCDDGKEAFFKISVPRKEHNCGITFMTLTQGWGSVLILRSDTKKSAVLMKKITPGYMLSSLKDNRKETAIAAELMKKMIIDPPESNHFPYLKDWTAVFKRMEKFDHPIPQEIIDAAGQIFKELDQSKKTEKLLHGDLHHENILFDQNEGWLAIDAKGVIAESAYNAARFLQNTKLELCSYADAVRLVEESIEIISGHLKEDSERLLKYAFLDSVMAACWKAEDNEKNLKSGIETAGLFFGLL